METPRRGVFTLAEREFRKCGVRMLNIVTRCLMQGRALLLHHSTSDIRHPSLTMVVSAFYKFVSLPDFGKIQGPLLELCRQHGVMGTILLAQEGINGTISGSRAGIDAVMKHIRDFAPLADLEHKESYCNQIPFKRMKVRLKRELISLGDPTIDPNERVGTYVEPHDWNALIDDPEVLLIDTRNDFEVEVGTFEGAVDPETESFTDFPMYVKRHLDPQKHKKIAMFCTGGIRCEKATSFMLREGFEKVYHLKGGILKYLEEVPEEKSKWQGECYVFDERVSVNHALEPGAYSMCHGCGRPLSEEDTRSKKYERGVSCPNCFDSLTDEQRAGFRERQKQVDLAKLRQEKHIGRVSGS